MKRFTKALRATSMAFAAASLMATSALATEGMFGNGTGARNKALAGAGVADQNDATAMSINPAGMIHSDNQLSFSASLFSPIREYNITTPGGVVGAESDSEYFVIPNIAWTHRVDGNTVFGLSMYGNGGMNTDYTANFLDPAAAPGTHLGIDYTQIFLSAGLAKQYGNFSIGFAPIVGIGIFSAEGLGNLAGAPETTQVSVGIGARGGIEYALSDSFRVAVAGATPIYMTAFQDYKNNLFFGSQGVLDVPGTLQAGVAFDLMPGMTVMADYKRIFYSGVEAIGGSELLGQFAWNDINVYKFGLEWDVNPGLTLRAGYSYNDNPLSSRPYNFFGNILAPATVQHHITGGAKMKYSDALDIEIAGMYAPEESVSTAGFDTGNPATSAPPSTVKMHQWEITAGFVWHTGETEAPIK